MRWGRPRGLAHPWRVAVNSVLVGLVRLQEVLVAELLVAELAVGFGVEDLRPAEL